MDNICSLDGVIEDLAAKKGFSENPGKWEKCMHIIVLQGLFCETKTNKT